MLKIGLTGGIGTGKSTIGEIFALLGIPVYYADQAAKKLMATNADLKEHLITTFGTATFTKKGELDTKYIANKVFNDEKALKQLNKLVHPAVLADFDNWCSQQHTPYILKEAALLIESGSYKQCDYTILVESPMALRIKRLLKRDKSNLQQIKARIASQLPDEEKAKLANFLILNDEEHLLIPQIIALHTQFLKGSSGI
ncbi:MAG: dephospho-CoA kinase [Sphingobacteriales bacterium]|nr:dephospho-CoA kinase [Sphingobacteriales bacterium]